MSKKIIIATGPKAGLAAANASSHLHMHKQHVMVSSFVKPFEGAVCSMFGLAISPADMDNPTQEFVGHRGRDVIIEMQSQLEQTFGTDILGRAATRRIKRETQATCFIFSDLPNIQCLRVLAIELGAKNIMLLQTGKPLDIEPHDLYVIKDADRRLLPAQDDPMMRLLVQGCVRDFMGLED